MTSSIAVAELLADLLVNAGARVAFGVASIHNLPILDALDRRSEIRCVPARGEAGAVNMADGFARSSGTLGVAVTSTGGGAGNACGALIEALTAGIPLLHITGQIESQYLDRERGFIHETKDQHGMLRALSKAAYRVRDHESLVATVRQAMCDALSAPMGPVSVEIPIDIQSAMTATPSPGETVPVPARAVASETRELDRIIEALRAARRAVLWLGGGARGATAAATRLADMGIAVVTTQHGRGIVSESHPMCLGNVIALPAVETFYAGCDALLIAGSRLRGNETINWKLKLPARRYQIDADALVRGRNYQVDAFALGDASVLLERIADALENERAPDPAFRADVAALKASTAAALEKGLGDYNDIVAALVERIPDDAVWVRDVTIANSMWANRLPALRHPGQNVNAVGTGIGQGLPMAIGAALGTTAKTVLVTGDGGLMLCLGELATLVQENLDVLVVVMNDGGYGVIRNIQDARFNGRHFLADLAAPSFTDLAKTFGLPAALARSSADVRRALDRFASVTGPALVEVDMNAVGAYAAVFAGSPVRQATKANV